jgi:hypothetical protein
MADYARVLAAVDQVLNTQGLDTYRGLQTDLAEDAAASDPVLIALTARITDEWAGTSAELLTKITPRDEHGRGPKDWPKARALTTLLRRQAPALRRLGWMVNEIPRDSSGYKVLRWRLKPPAPSEQRRSANGADNADNAENRDKPAGDDAVDGSANASASPRQPLGVAENSATRDSSPSNAEHNAETSAPLITCENVRNSATSATSATNPHLLWSGDLLVPAPGTDHCDTDSAQNPTMLRRNAS